VLFLGHAPTIKLGGVFRWRIDSDRLITARWGVDDERPHLTFKYCDDGERKMAVNKKEMAAGLASAVALISGAQVANAADVDVGPVVGHDWDGLYVGLSAGLQWGDVPISLSNDYNMNGDIAFGGFIGVNHQYDNGFVVGAELAAQTGNDTDDGDDGGDYDVNYTIDAKLKLGMAFGAEDQLLVYGFAGPSVSTIDFGSDAGTYTSWSANFGIGAAWMITEQFSIGAELMGRAPIDEYQWSDADENAGINGQATLRAAFHF
jgi:opacity protein-like surface antigen